MQAITIGKLLRRRLRDRKGFSLIETSVLVSAAAAAAVGFLSWTQPAAVTNSENAVETRAKMDAIAKAMENFRVEKGRLPCPADPYMRVDNTRSSTGGTDHYPNDFGQEDLDTIETIVNGVTNYGVDCPVSAGAIPVYAIGLGQEYMNDAWGRRFTYQISKTVCAADAGTEGGVSTANSRLFGCTKNDYNKGNGDIIIKDTAAVTKADKAVAVIVSHGPNGKGAFMPSGVKLANDGSANEIENGNSDNTGSATDKTFIMGTASATFDDIVYFKTKVQMERLTDRANTKQISVADCQANSTAIRAITATESTVMATQVTGFERGANNTSNTGEQVALSLLKTIQSMCVTYYGATTGITPGWSGAQCPGTANVAAGSTYYAPTDTCTCLGGAWDGNCVADFNMIAASVLPTTGRALWLDASDPATLFTDTGCTAAAVATNSVACWKDKSGNSGRNATQSGNKPTYQTGATAGTGSGKNAVRFTSASNQYLDTTAFDIGQNTTICSVFKSLTTANMAFFNVTGGATPELLLRTDTGNLAGVMWNGSNHGSASMTASTGAFHTMCYRYNNSANQAQFSVDGNLGAVVTADVSNAGSVTRRIGAHWNSAPYDGYIGELLVYSRAVTDLERKSIEQYFGLKWGITVAP